jgi:hypothetical protein
MTKHAGYICSGRPAKVSERIAALKSRERQHHMRRDKRHLVTKLIQGSKAPQITNCKAWISRSVWSAKVAVTPASSNTTSGPRACILAMASAVVV